MFIAQIQIKIVKKEDIKKQSNVIYSLLANLFYEGRVLDNNSAIFQKQDFFISTAQIPSKDALRNLNKLKYLKEDFERLKEIGLKQPTFEILGKATEFSESCSCKDSSAYILITNFLSIQSPIKCFDCSLPIPLYRIKQTEPQQLRYVLGWQSEYKACDLLQMHCGFGERFGVKQMSDINSSLSKTGLELCFEISKLTSKSYYYYLYRYNGKSIKKEKERKCPRCNGEWLLAEPFYELCDFKCDKYYLLSNIAFNIK